MQHIDMACSAALSAMQQGGAAGAGGPSGAQRFAELVNQQCAGNAPDVYVASNLPAAGGPQAYPLLETLTKIQNMDLGGSADADAYKPNDQPISSTDTDHASSGSDDGLDQIRAINDEMIAAQREIVNTTILLESVNLTRQGTSTMFQLQG